MSDIMSLLTAEAQKSYQANLKRYQQAEKIFDEIIAMYGPEGTFGKSYEAELEKQKVSDVGKTKLTDISRGLYGTTDYGAAWESQVGASARLKLEDIKMERLSAAQAQKAGFLTSIEEPYPDYGLMASLMSQGTSGAGGGAAGAVGGGGGYQSTSQVAADWASRLNYSASLGGGGLSSSYSPYAATSTTPAVLGASNSSGISTSYGQPRGAANVQTYKGKTPYSSGNGNTPDINAITEEIMANYSAMTGIPLTGQLPTGTTGGTTGAQRGAMVNQITNERKPVGAAGTTGSAWIYDPNASLNPVYDPSDVGAFRK
jgi:hypothetical protein